MGHLPCSYGKPYLASMPCALAQDVMVREQDTVKRQNCTASRVLHCTNAPPLFIEFIPFSSRMILLLSISDTSALYWMCVGRTVLIVDGHSGYSRPPRILPKQDSTKRAARFSDSELAKHNPSQTDCFPYPCSSQISKHKHCPTPSTPSTPHSS